jgi:3-hydroxyacyl-[acyl-carrier-protein] dehydratase
MISDETLAVEAILPHRPPFLFVSRIVSVDPGKSATTEYDVPHDLFIFEGHFPGEPILPGVIVMEMMAQSGGLAFLSQEGMHGKVAYLAGIDHARFRKPVRPGDTIRADVEIVSQKRRIGKAVGKAYVGGEEAASATILFAMPN